MNYTADGHITTIDLEVAKKREPNIECLLTKLGLLEKVSIYYEPTSYTWRLMKFLEERPRRQFDLCYIDGPHSWFVDGFGFFLVDLLLKEGGWIIFDDLYWTFSESPALGKTDWVKEMPEDERTTPQILKIYELLVKPNFGYHNFQTIDGWAFAQKKSAFRTDQKDREIVVERVFQTQIQKEYYGIGWFLFQLARKIMGQK